MMPEMDGIETCRGIRSLPGGARTPIVLLTGLEDYDSIRRAYDVGATDFLSKPFNPLILGHRIRHIYRASGMLMKLGKSEAALAKSQQIAELGSWELDVASRALAATAEALRLLEISPGVQGELGSLDGLLARLASKDRESLRAAIGVALREGDAFVLEHSLELPSGTRRIVRTQGEPLLNEQEECHAIVGTLQDITATKDVEERIHTLAYYDSLTGLPNRLLFMDRMKQALATAGREEINVAVLFVDLDQFKRVNDTLGHDAGDQLLAEVGRRLMTAVRDVDTVSHHLVDFDSNGRSEIARLCGDEFTVVLTRLKYIQDAAKVAQRIIESLSEPVQIDGHEFVVTASIGIALFPMDGTSGEELLKHSDTAMYHAKEQGKNNFQFFSLDMNARAFERLTVENGLRRGLENDELVVHYQPKVSLVGKAIEGFEGLVRWRQEGVGLVPPALFLQVADEAGIVARLDRVVLQQACCQLSDWRACGLDHLRVSVNVSEQFFRLPEFTETVAETLNGCGLPSHCLELEFAESVITNCPAIAPVRLQDLKSLGVRLVIDNFGSGLSCLSQLRQLPVDVLKIDRSFARELGEGKGSEAVVKAIVELGHSLGLTVVAEGVETPEQFDLFHSYGCDSVQGYYFSEPLACDDVMGFVDTFEERFEECTCTLSLVGNSSVTSLP
jgi:diguanylate cyclase (GGDEF)-like protein